MFDFLQRDTFSFWHHKFNPDQVQHHHEAEKGEDVSGREGGDHAREERREKRRKYPVGGAAERLASGAMAVREDLRDEYPNDRALSYGVCCDEGEDARRHDREML